MEKNIELFDHNEEAYEKLIKTLETNQFVSINHATGTGKSFIILKYLYQNRNKRILYLAPTYQIIDQLVTNHTKELGISMDEFTTFDTLIYSNLLKENIDELKDKYDLIILDEYHRCGARKWGKKVNELLSKIKQSKKDIKVVGTTATEIRYLDNNRNMNNIIFDGVCASTLTLADAILKGILPPPVYVKFNFDLIEELELIRGKIKRNLIYPDDIKKYMEICDKLISKVNLSINDFSELKKYLAKTGKYLVFSSTMNKIKKDKKIIDQILGSNCTNYSITSMKPALTNNQILRKFRESDSNTNHVLYSINILNEGIHVKNVDAIFMLRKTTSPIIYFQQLGRLLSHSRRDDKVVIFDLVNNLKNHEVIYNLYKEVVERAKELLKTDLENKERYEKILDTFKIVDETSSVVSEIEKLKDLTSGDNLLLERLKTAVTILENQDKYEYSLIIQAYIDIFKLEEYITIDLYDRISNLKIEKPKIFDFNRENFINYLNGALNIKEKKSGGLNNFVNEIMIFYNSKFHLPSVFSEDDDEKLLAKELLNNFNLLNNSQKAKIRRYVDDDLSLVEQLTYSKKNIVVDFEILYKELDFLISENIYVSENILELLGLENTKESITYLKKIVHGNASYYLSFDIEEDKIFSFADDSLESDKRIDATTVLLSGQFESLNEKIMSEFTNSNKDEYLLNLTNSIINFININKRMPRISGNLEFEKELFYKRIILKPFLDNLGYEAKINEAYFLVMLDLKKIKKEKIYTDLISFMESHEGEMPSSKSNDSKEKQLALLVKRYYDLFEDEKAEEIKQIQGKFPTHHLIVIKKYISFIKKYKRRPVCNASDSYEVKLYESFQRIEEYLTDEEKMLIEGAVGKINRYKETRTLYQEMLNKKGR